MFVEVIQITGPRNEVNKKGNAYQILEVAFKDQAGKVNGKKLLSFQNPEVFNFFAKAKQGDKFNVTSEKVGDFWNWVGVESTTGFSAGPQTSSGSPQNQGQTSVGSRLAREDRYETPEERALNRLRIGRQAALNTAVEFFKAAGKKPVQDDVIETAAAFERWVHRDSSGAAKAPSSNHVSLEEDIPY